MTLFCIMRELLCAVFYSICCTILFCCLVYSCSICMFDVLRVNMCVHKPCVVIECGWLEFYDGPVPRRERQGVREARIKTSGSNPPKLMTACLSE